MAAPTPAELAQALSALLLDFNVEHIANFMESCDRCSLPGLAGRQELGGLTLHVAAQCHPLREADPLHCASTASSLKAG